MKTSIKRNQLSRFRHGAATVEFALSAIILFLFFFGSIEFARLAIMRHVIDNVAFEACRRVIVPGANANEAEVYVQTVLARYGVTGVSIDISPSVINESTTSVTLQVQAPASSNRWGLSKFSEGLTLRSTSTLLTPMPVIPWL